jgi:hypothetical protein
MSSSSSHSYSCPSSSSTSHAHGLTWRACTVRSSSCLMPALAQASTDAYGSCASARAHLESMTCGLMASTCRRPIAGGTDARQHGPRPPGAGHAAPGIGPCESCSRPHPREYRPSRRGWGAQDHLWSHYSAGCSARGSSCTGCR